jgi:hypothetical protein
MPPDPPLEVIQLADAEPGPVPATRAPVPGAMPTGTPPPRGLLTSSAAPPSRPPEVGSTVKHYELLRKLGEGGMLRGTDDSRLWTAIPYCMSVEQRVVLLNEPEARAQGDQDACERRVQAATRSSAEGPEGSDGAR